MNERALLAITDILKGYARPPGFNWPDHEKEKATFGRWALEEILLLVWDHPQTLASETIERFAMRLELFTAMAVTETQNRIFAVASEAAWDLFEKIRMLE